MYNKKKLLKEIAHNGEVKMKAIKREYFCSLDLDCDIGNYIKSSHTFMINSINNAVLVKFGETKEVFYRVNI